MTTSHHNVIRRDRAQFWALLALIVYVPLPLASNRPWAVGLLGLLVGGLLLWNIWRPSGRSPAEAWQSARTPLVLLALWMALLTLQLIPMPTVLLDALRRCSADGLPCDGRGTISIDIYATGLYLVKACILTAVFWLAVTLVNSSRRIVWMGRIIVLSGLFQALLGVVMMATGASFQFFFVSMLNPRAHGTFVYHNHFAGYLELTLAVGIGLMISQLDGRVALDWRRRLRSWLAVLLSEKALLRMSLIIMVVGLVASRSRMGNMAFFASLLITGVLMVAISRFVSQQLRERRAKDLMRATILFIASLVVLDVVIIGGVLGLEKVVQRIENTHLETQFKESSASAAGLVVPVSEEESLEQRTRAARAALQIVGDHPWLGTGGGTFPLAFPHYQPADVAGYYEHAHNDYVEFASETGLLGLLLLALMAGDSAWRSVKLLVHSHDQLARGMAFASLMGMISLLIHGFVDFNLQNPANAMLFLILLCLPYQQGMLRR